MAERREKSIVDVNTDVVSHRGLAEAEHQRILLAEHRPPRGQGRPRPDPHSEEKAILAAVPEMAEYVAALKRRGRKIWRVGKQS